MRCVQLLWYTNTCSYESRENCIPDPVPQGNGSCTRMIQLRPTSVSSGMKWLTFVLTVMLIVLILDYYRFQLKVERQRLRAPDLQLWHIKKLSVALVIELVVCSFHPLPFLRSLDESVDVSNPYGFFGESRWTTAMFLRCYLCFRVLRDRYPLYRKRGRLEADLMARGLPPPRFDWFLSFKATFHTSGPKWLMSILVIVVTTLAYCHSLAEREFQPELFHSGIGFLLYYTILLMTAGGPSVGAPCSGWGQAVGIVTCLSGVIILALTVTVVETKLSLSDKATTALKWDEYDICNQKERNAAARYIQKLWKLNNELSDRPALRASRKFLRRRAITRSVVSVDLAEARRRRVLAERELGWLPMDNLAEQWAESEVGRRNGSGLFRASIFTVKNPNVCQDRLGTNIGKLDTKGRFLRFLQEDQLQAAKEATEIAAQTPTVALAAGGGGSAGAAVVPPELMTTLNQILSAQAELARVQESLVQVRESAPNPPPI